MKKFSGVSFLSLLSITLVSAQDRLSSGLSKGMNQVLDIISAFLGPFFSAILGGTGETLFQKVLFLAIVLTLVYVILDKMPVFKKNGTNNQVIIWIITISVSLLSTRFMSAELLVAMLLPYTTLGVVLTAGLPLVIFFAFVQGIENKYTRKIMWIFFAVTFLVVWSSRSASLGEISRIYFGTAIVAILMFLFDGTIRRLMIKAKYEQFTMDERKKMAAGIRKQIKELNESEEFYSDKKAFERHRDRLQRTLMETERKVLKP